VQIDKSHRSGERRDLVGDAILHIAGALLGVSDQGRTNPPRNYI
jgi:hypothetical protein